jgi:hypothetical protein
MKVSSFGISKNIWKLFFSFLTYKLLYAKIGFSHIFAGGSSGQQLSPISLPKSERSLTQVSMVKV